MYIILLYIILIIVLAKIINRLFHEKSNILISTICGNYFTQHIPLHIPRRSLNKPKTNSIIIFYY